MGVIFNLIVGRSCRSVVEEVCRYDEECEGQDKRVAGVVGVEEGVLHRLAGGGGRGPRFERAWQ